MLHQRETECFCFCQVNCMAAGGMAHLTFILMEGSQDIHLTTTTTRRPRPAPPTLVRFSHVSMTEHLEC
jgi:hypothetical protein